MPSALDIENFYQGFSFQTNPLNFQKVCTPQVEKWMRAIVPSIPGKMLDVGGGGGFFAKAFENFGLGESTYIDLDSSACKFAADEMKLTRVIYDSVENLYKHTSGQKFDFIYCRHVIEHLVDPLPFIFACAGLLSERGVLVVQCPNGQSKEGLLFPRYWMKFLKKFQASNKWGFGRTLIFSLSSKYGWGIDPIRHLWAISEKGLVKSFQNQPQFNIKIYSASLSDSAFSPYWMPASKVERLVGIISKLCAGKLFKGMHLIAEIRRKP